MIGQASLTVKHHAMRTARAWNADRQGARGWAADKKDQAPRQDAKPARRRSPRAPDTHVANALRCAYEDAVREDVPREFLDLLGKLA